MISWTITVPPTVGTAIATGSSSYQAADAQYMVEVIILDNGATVAEVVAQGGGVTYNSFSYNHQTLENGNSVFYQTYVDNQLTDGGGQGALIASWDGNVFFNDDAGLVASTITYEEQTTTNETTLTVAYDTVQTTVNTITGALTTVDASVYPTTRNTTTLVDTIKSKTSLITAIVITTQEGEILAYNGNTGQRLIATVIIPENERVYVPDAFGANDPEAASLDFGPLPRVATLAAGSGGSITVKPLIKTKAALSPIDENNNPISIGDPTTITDAWIFRPTFASAAATTVATNPFVYPSPLGQASVPTITTFSNQEFTGTSETTTLNSDYLVPVCVSTTRTIDANLLGQQFTSTVYSTTVSNFVLPINTTGSESFSSSFEEGYPDLSSEPGYTSGSTSLEGASGFTTCLWGYQELGYVPNNNQGVYAKSFLAGRAAPADLTNPKQNLQAGGLTLTVPETVLANQTVYLPRPMISWSYSNSNTLTIFSLDAEGATVITAFSNDETSEISSSESGQWIAQGQAATICNVAGNQQINAGGAAATGQITAIYGAGWYATTNENGDSGVKSYDRVVTLLQSAPDASVGSTSGDVPWQRLARSSMEQFVASVRYGQGQAGGPYFTTVTRNPTTHIVGNELVI